MKKLIAVAVLGALAAPAFADSGNVTISGNLRAGVQFLNKAASAPRDFNGDGDFLDPGEARDAKQTQIDGRGQIQFNMSEDLGNGLTAVGQIRSRFAIDGSGRDEGDTKRDGTFGNHNTWVGLKGSFGQVRLGRGEDNFGDGKHDNLELYGDVLHGRISSTSNMVRYDLPAMGGFSGSLQWSTGEDKATGHKATTGTVLRVDYDAANWDVGAAYEKVSLQGGSIKNWEITGGVKFGDWALGLEHEQVKASGISNKIKSTTLYAGASFGKIDFQGQYGRQKVSGVSGKTTTYSLGLNYNLSKRTKFFTEYMSIKTDIGGISADRASKFFVGLKHSF